jgi:hypothetical protein
VETTFISTNLSTTANRIIEIYVNHEGLSCSSAASSPVDACQLRIYMASTCLAETNAVAIQPGYEAGSNGFPAAWTTTTAGLNTYAYKGVRVSGNGTWTVSGTANGPLTMWINDVGPSASPA